MSIEIQDMHRATAEKMGDWDGNEELAAEQFNKLLEIIAGRVDETDYDLFCDVKKCAADRLEQDFINYSDNDLEMFANRFI